MTTAGDDSLTGRPRALCFGELLVDRLPSGPVPGGAPANVAYHLRLLGIDALPVTAIGEDDDGALLSGHLRACRIPDDFVATDPRRPTGTVDVAISPEGEPSYSIRQNVAWDHIPSSPRLLAQTAGVDALLFGSLALRSSSNRRLLGQLLARSSGMALFDINLRPPWDQVEPIREFAAGADVMKMNQGEADRLARSVGETRYGGEGNRRRDVLQRIGAAFGPSGLCVTRGAEGADLLVAGEFLSEPGRPVRVVDTIGAGDAFLAGLLAGLLTAPDKPERALRQGCRLGELVASRPGATPRYDPREVLEAFPDM